MRYGTTSVPTSTKDQSTHNIVQIGFQHGSEAQQQISRCIDFYADLFLESAKKNWQEVRRLAMTFEPTIRKNWPAYLEEMEGG
jgi:isopenicillin-N N-acyltransferase-like protein